MAFFGTARRSAGLCGVGAESSEAQNFDVLTAISRSAPDLFRPVRYKPYGWALFAKNFLLSVGRFFARIGHIRDIRYYESDEREQQINRETETLATTLV